MREYATNYADARALFLCLASSHPIFEDEELCQSGISKRTVSEQIGPLPELFYQKMRQYHLLREKEENQTLEDLLSGQDSFELNMGDCSSRLWAVIKLMAQEIVDLKEQIRKSPCV